jgi:hypothetical protein
LGGYLLRIASGGSQSNSKQNEDANVSTLLTILMAIAVHR